MPRHSLLGQAVVSLTDGWRLRLSCVEIVPVPLGSAGTAARARAPGPFCIPTAHAVRVRAPDRRARMLSKNQRKTAAAGYGFGHTPTSKHAGSYRPRGSVCHCSIPKRSESRMWIGATGQPGEARGGPPQAVPRYYWGRACAPGSSSMHLELDVSQFTFSPKALSADYPQWDLIREVGRSRLTIVLMSLES